MLQDQIRVFIVICISYVGKCALDAEGYFNSCENFYVRVSCQYKSAPYSVLKIDDVIYGINDSFCGSTSTLCAVNGATDKLVTECAGKASCTTLVSSSKYGTSCGTSGENFIRIKFSCDSSALPFGDLVLDGWWSQWGAWSACSASCGSGTKNRNRACDAPPPQNSAVTCNGQSASSATCDSGSCQVDDNSCCSCGSTTNITLTTAELEQKLQEIKTELYINKRKLSSSVRLKTSATDNRPSSVVMGTAAIVFLSVVVISVLSVDAKRFYDGTKALLNYLRKNNSDQSGTKEDKLSKNISA